MKFILIIMVIALNQQEIKQIHTQEFDSEETCARAVTKIRQGFIHSEQNIVRMDCVRK